MNKIYFEIRSYDAKTNTPIRFRKFDNYDQAEKTIWNLPDGKKKKKKVFEQTQK